MVVKRRLSSSKSLSSSTSSSRSGSSSEFDINDHIRANTEQKRNFFNI